MKVALVGTCPSSRMLAPYGDPSFEIWACGPDNAGGVLPRVTRWIEVHTDLDLPGGQPWEKSYIKWLNDNSGAGAFTLIATDTQRCFPGAERFPWERLVQRFDRLFFTSSPAWMMAYAIMLGAKQIGLFGLDMSSRGEYLHERPGMQYFIQLAEKAGISVFAPTESDLMQPAPLYGLDKATAMGRKLEVRRQELLGRIAGLDAEIAKAQHDKAYLQGALDDLDYVQSIWGGSASGAIMDTVERRPEPMSNVVNLTQE